MRASTRLFTKKSDGERIVETASDRIGLSSVPAVVLANKCANGPWGGHRPPTDCDTLCNPRYEFAVQFLVVTISFGPSTAVRGRMNRFIDVDPGDLYLPPALAQGADPGKLARQIAR